MSLLNSFSAIDANIIIQAARDYGTPSYLYDESFLIQRCRDLLNMPHAFGLTVRYAMKANSTKAILSLIHGQGINIDASSLNEAKRAYMAGIPYEDIILTTQEVPLGSDRNDLEAMLLKGMKYNVCSVRQLQLIADFAAQHGLPLSIRVHPGIGAGESASRNTGDNYSCFGVHLSDLNQAIDIAQEKGLIFNQVHVHIGSGGSPSKWKENITRELSILEKYFPDAQSISFGGGLKEARVPGEEAADPQFLGGYAKEQLEAFYTKSGRKLHMEIEPGTYLMANAGYIITQVMDKKYTGPEGMHFLVLDGGMEVNARPLLYGSQHPFYIITQKGRLLSSEFDPDTLQGGYQAAVAGRCCETGDSQTLDDNGLNAPRRMAEPQMGDYVVIGGAGAYCSAMTPFNYNSHQQAPEIMWTKRGELALIRKHQSLLQIVENEV